MESAVVLSWKDMHFGTDTWIHFGIQAYTWRDQYVGNLITNHYFNTIGTMETYRPYIIDIVCIRV
jgi:hypothetical protein